MIPLWIRILHWVIAVLLLLLIITGITQHFSTAQFSIIDYSVATTIHEVGGITLSIVYVLFLVGIFITGYWRKYVPHSKNFWRHVWGQSLFFGRNPAIVFLILPLLVITGLIYLYPGYLPEKVLGFDGLWTIAVGHYVIGVIGTAYTIGHIFMALLTGTVHKMIYGRIRTTRMNIN